MLDWKKAKSVFDGDLIVLGGGPAGVAAAICAARAGLNVMLIERYGFLGGQATGGYIVYLPCISDGTQVLTKGFFAELLDRLCQLGGVRRLAPGDERSDLVLHAECLKFVLDSLVTEAGVELRLHSFAIGLWQEEGPIAGVFLASKSGIQRATAKYFVDATGDADMAEWCGIPCRTRDASSGEANAVTTVYRLGNVDVDRAVSAAAGAGWGEVARQAMDTVGMKLQVLPTMIPGEVWCNNLHLFDIDATNAVDLTRAELTGRKRVQQALAFYRRHVPGFEDCQLLETAPMIGVRESRLVVGEYVVTPSDLSSGRRFEDSIAKCGSWKTTVSCDLPYRSLVSRKIPNLIFAGRCVSVSPEIVDYVRQIPTCSVVGQAAGLAVGVAIRKRAALVDLEVKELQDMLRATGGVL